MEKIIYCSKPYMKYKFPQIKTFFQSRIGKTETAAKIINNPCMIKRSILENKGIRGDLHGTYSIDKIG